MEFTRRCELSDVKTAAIGSGTGPGFVVPKMAMGLSLGRLKCHWDWVCDA